MELKKDSACGNRFADALELAPASKPDTKRLQRQAASSGILSKGEERTLDRSILDNIGNGIYIGVLLIKEAGFSSQEACALTWDRVRILEFPKGATLIEHQREETAGARYGAV